MESDRYDAELSQLGKENISATISQDKTIFTANEIADGTITDGTIVAHGAGQAFGQKIIHRRMPKMIDEITGSEEEQEVELD